MPNALELIKNSDDGQLAEFMFAPLEVGRPFAPPPETPPAIVAALRKAFSELAVDPEFVAEVRARGGSIEFLDGQNPQQLVDKSYNTPAEILNRARAVLRASRQ